jgi:iron complex outermembrane receptor protein
MSPVMNDRLHRRAARAWLAHAALTAALLAQDPQPQKPAALELEDLTLEQLMEVPVEVGARQAESLAATAASVFVLNEPEIRRSGMRSVPELLRLVPGLIIAQDVPGAYGFSSRLGEYEFAGMLVLIDGQRLYPTLLRREYFQAIDLPIASISRIEVVRGPGGARWGDKASQGVINIVTKKAAETHGLRLTGVLGTEERLVGTFRYGASAGENSDFYVFGKLAQRDGGHPKTAGDRWDNNSIGGRIDTTLAGGELTIDGLYHDSFLGDSYVFDPGFTSQNMIKGGHVKSRLRFDHGDGQSTELRLAADAYDQDIRDLQDDALWELLRYREELFDGTVRHAWRPAADHTFTLGLGLRSLTVETYEVVSTDGEEYNETRGDLFATWDWNVTSDLRLTLGANVGYQDGLDGSGVDAQPDLRLSWTPAPDFTLWTAWSANHEPDQKIADSGLLVRRRSSSLLAWELGLRRRFGEHLLLQVDTFLYEVDDQINGYDTDPGTGATLYREDGRTNAFGGEISAAWNTLDGLRVSAFLATTEANSRNFDAAEFSDGDTIEGQVPRLRGGLTLGYEIVPGLELDTNLLYTQRRADIPRWWRLDARLAWHASDNTSVELVGQNLTDPHHPEYYYLEEVERGCYLMVTHRF